MAFRRTLAHRLFNLSNISSPSQKSSAARSSGIPWAVGKLLPSSGEDRGRRRLFQAAVPLDRLHLPLGEQLLDKIRGLNRQRVRIDGLKPPPPPLYPAEEEEGRITAEEVEKVLRASQMEAVRERLRRIPRNCVSYSEFEQICDEAAAGASGRGLAWSLDESGSVVVLGDLVILRPELIMGAIKSMIPRRNKELIEMEEEKSKIDEAAEAQVRRELWCGLGFLLLQTAGFMRLTFWELSWDVMEPICFFATSVYFMAGYAFFLRTSRDPSFEGFFESRFASKQKRLMRSHNFDLDKFNELRGGQNLTAPHFEKFNIPSLDCNCHCKNTSLGHNHH